MNGTSDSELICAIYDAALNAEAWNRLPDLLRSRVDAASAVFWYRQPDGAFAGSVSNVGATALDLYGSYYGTLDPWGAAAESGGRLGQVLLGSELVSESEFRQTEFYADFARHQGTHQMLGVGRRYRSGTLMAFAAHRPFGVSPFGEQHRASLQQLFPHLERMIKLRIELLARQTSVLPEAVLSRAMIGIAVCDEHSEVLYTNPAAERAARASGLMLAVRCGRICAERRSKTLELRSAIAAAARSGASTTVLLECEGGGRTFVIVGPLEGEDCAARHRALVVIRPDHAEAALDRSTIAALFGLTRAEAEVVLRILSGGSIRDVCAERHVTENTARTQLAIAMQKIGVSNQRELVMLLGRLQPIS